MPPVDASVPVARKPRVRLQPEVRKRLVLDAALAEFSAHGYEATRIDDIAARAGLSKGGFYAHFASKEEVFEALLRRSLVPPHIDAEALTRDCPDFREFARRLIAVLYRRLSEPDLTAMVRLLVTEGHRLPAIVAEWRRANVEVLIEAFGGLLRRAVALGLCRDGIVVREPALLLSPLVHEMLGRLMGSAGAGPFGDEAEAVHLELLCELFDPR